MLFKTQTRAYHKTIGQTYFPQQENSSKKIKKSMLLSEKQTNKKTNGGSCNRLCRKWKLREERKVLHALEITATAPNQKGMLYLTSSQKTDGNAFLITLPVHYFPAHQFSLSCWFLEQYTRYLTPTIWTTTQSLFFKNLIKSPHEPMWIF